MEVRRRSTLMDQMAVPHSLNLRELLKVREENERPPNLTLASIIEKRETDDAAASHRRSHEYHLQNLTSTTTNDSVSTHNDSVVNIAESNGGSASGSGSLGGGGGRNKISWKFFKDRLLQRRSAAAWVTSPPSIAISAQLISPIVAGSPAETATPARHSAPSGMSPSRDAARTDLATALAAERQHRRSEAAALAPAEREEAGAPVRVSLMALLEQAEVCPVAGYGEGEEEAAAAAASAAAEAKDRLGREDYVCCVCMVREKGAAFIPCGHTFCRLCSRELWISRGNCPLCNGSIMEVLDIF